MPVRRSADRARPQTAGCFTAEELGLVVEALQRAYIHHEQTNATRTKWGQLMELALDEQERVAALENLADAARRVESLSLVELPGMTLT